MVSIQPPRPELADCVAWYWSVHAAPDAPVHLRVDVYVDARADLVFNFGAPYRRTRLGGPSEIVHASNFDAQRTTPIVIEQHGAVSVAGIRFRAGGVAPFTDATLADLTDRVVPVDVLFGPDALDLEASLRSVAGDIVRQAALFDAFLLPRRRRDRSRDAFECLLGRLTDPGPGTSVAAAAEACGVSARQAARLFQRHLGLAPRTMLLVARFQRALDAMAAAPDGTIAEIAAACGYYDQAHLVRDVRRFAGGPPTGFRGYFPRQAPKEFAPNVVRFAEQSHLEPSAGRRGSDSSKTRAPTIPTMVESPDPTAVATPRRPSVANAPVGSGTKEDPWKLTTPPGTSAYTMYRDDEADPPLLVCQVGKTKLTYLARSVEDLHAFLKERGDWVPLGGADEQKPAAPDTVEGWGRSPDNPVGGWYGTKKGLRGRFGVYLPPLLEALGLAELEHDKRNNRMRAI